MSSLLGRKADDVLDTLGCWCWMMTNLNLGSGMSTKGSKISILAFEVAKTMVKGANLMHSLSNESIRHLKEVVLPSKGVQNLISRDMNELLRIAALDKRDELKVFAGEVARFGNRSKDPHWRNLDFYFKGLQELYHEMQVLDRLEQDYWRKGQEEDNPNAPPRGYSLAILPEELKSQKKHVYHLKKKSLWWKILEEVMEKLVGIVHFLHLEIRHSAFGSSANVTDGDEPAKNDHPKLGSAGLALHYANIITQIDTLVTRSNYVPPSTRDALYQGLPTCIKSALRTRLQSLQHKEQVPIPQIKAEMEKTLQWLVPMATNTTKGPHGYIGWVGDWANTGSIINRKPAGQTDLLRIETLHHADKEKTEAYILELVVWLHQLIRQSRTASDGLIRSPVKSPISSPTIQSSSSVKM